jgi:hypothetical protein
MINRYFRWSVSDNYPENLWLKFSEENKGTSGMFSSGNSIESPEPIIFSSTAIKSSQIKKYSQIMTAGGGIINEEIKNILSAIDADGIQYFKARLDLKDGSIFGYYVCNITRLVDVLDINKSTFRHILPNDKSSPLIPVKRVYNMDLLNGQKIGRVRGDLANIIVHEDIANALNGYKGMGFIPIEGEFYI